MSSDLKQQITYIEGVHKFQFDPGYEVCRIECSGFYARQAQNFSGGSKEVDFMLYHPGKRELWLIEVKDYRFDARPKFKELTHILSRKVKDSLFLLRAGAVGSPEEIPLEGMSLREFARLSSEAITLRLAFLLELNGSHLFPEGAMFANMRNMLLGQMRFLDENLVCAPITFPSKIGPWKTSSSGGEVSLRVLDRREKHQKALERKEQEAKKEKVYQEDNLPLWKKRLILRQEGKKGNRSDRRGKV